MMRFPGCTPRPEVFETDEDLFGYAVVHSETELGLFSEAQVARICAIAGVPFVGGRAWFSVDRWTMKELVAKARERMRPVG